MNAPISKINWPQIFSLGFLNAAVVISWIAYHNYQPKLLQLFDFTDLSFFLVVAQALILVFIPPIAGLAGDYMIRKNSNYFVVFTVGISVTAMVFMAVAFTIGFSDLINLRPLLPFMIVLWLISMNIFHSPANSMLELFAPTKQLPTVMVVLAMVTETLMGLEPVIVDIVDFVGAPLTFAAGGSLLIIGGYLFKRTTKNAVLVRDKEDAASDKNNFLLVITAGLLSGIAVGMFMNIFPIILPGKLEGFFGFISNGNQYVSMLLLIAAACAYPAGKMAEKYGVKVALLAGALLLYVAISLVYVSTWQPLSLFAYLLSAVSFSIVSVSAFPFALMNLSPRQVTMGTGIFFGATELTDGILNIYFNM